MAWGAVLAAACAQSGGAQGGGAQGARELLARGDSLWGAGKTDSAAVVYRAALALDSLASAGAVLRVANVFAWTSRTDSALRWYARFERMEPHDASGPIGRARALAWASRYEGSLAVLDSLVRAAPSERDAVLLRAQVAAWAGDLTGSTAEYRAWIGTHAGDDEARAGLARTLSWDGKFEEAAAEYRALEVRMPAEAAKGLARLTSWRGDLEGSRAQWTDVTVRYPKDPEGWTGLAQVQRWQGRVRESDTALGQALALSPGDPDAIAQRAWVKSDLAPSGEVLLAYSNDSDQNQATTLAVTTGVAPAWQGRATVMAQVRRASLGAFIGTTTSLRAATTWTPSGTAWSLRGEVGISLLTDNQAATVQGTAIAYVARASGTVAEGVVAGVTVAGGSFDETATLITKRIRTDGVDGDLAVTLPGRFSLLGGIGWAKVGNGATPNSRLTLSGAVHYALSRGSWLGVRVRSQGYDTTAAGDGYFAPQRFTVAELAAHFELPKDIGWNVLADAGVGTQSIAVTGTPTTNTGTQRAQLGVLFRPEPGQEFSAAIWIANVASPFTVTTDYRAGGVIVRGRLRF